jgi:predicted metal-dependent phosphoesterase TrpH
MLPVRRDAPAFPLKPDGWYRGELHCHTYHSDGDSAPLELVRAAQALGLDFLAITDHNTLSHLIDLAAIDTPNLILIPGVEVTTYKGHWNVWGDSGWIDFRTLTPERMESAIQVARERVTLTSCNHPRPYGPAWEFGGRHLVTLPGGLERSMGHL